MNENTQKADDPWIEYAKDRQIERYLHGACTHLNIAIAATQAAKISATTDIADKSPDFYAEVAKHSIHLAQFRIEGWAKKCGISMPEQPVNQQITTPPTRGNPENAFAEANFHKRIATSYILQAGINQLRKDGTPPREHIIRAIEEIKAMEHWMEKWANYAGITQTTHGKNDHPNS